MMMWIVLLWPLLIDWWNASMNVSLLALIVNTMMWHVIIYDAKVFAGECCDVEVFAGECYDVEVFADECCDADVISGKCL